MFIGPPLKFHGERGILSPPGLFATICKTSRSSVAMLWNTVLVLKGLRANLTYRLPGSWGQRRAAQTSLVDRQ